MSDNLTTTEKRLLYGIYQRFEEREFSTEELYEIFSKDKWKFHLNGLTRKKMFHFQGGLQIDEIENRSISAQGLDVVALIRESKSLEGLLVKHGYKVWAAILTGAGALLIGLLRAFGEDLYQVLQKAVEL